MTPLPLDQILHGDSIEIMNAMPAKCVDLVFADPPYNLQLRGDLLRPDMSQVDAANDDWDQFASNADYDAFTRAWLTACQRVMKDTATLWVIGSYHNIYRVGAILMDLGFWFLNDVVWIKNNPTPHMKGVRFCNAHETLLWMKKSEQAKGYTFHYKALKAANDDVQMRSDWYFPVCQGFERQMVDGEKAHTTQKPEALLHRIIVATSNPGDVVLDPFCGTGTTAAVAKRLGRRFITADLDERYVQVARRRVEHVSTSLFDEEDAIVIDQPKPRVAFASLVERGVLPPGTQLKLRRRDITATVNADGTISAGGYRGSIHKVGKLCLGLPACNGWEHWFYTDRLTGALVSIDSLRPERVLGKGDSDGA
jgi:DNA modification methylase